MALRWPLASYAIHSFAGPRGERTGMWPRAARATPLFRRRDVLGVSLLEVYLIRLVSECANAGFGILQIVDCRVVIVLIVHATEPRIGIQHSLLYLHARIFHQCGSDAQPLARRCIKSTDSHLGISSNLLSYVLPVAILAIRLAERVLKESAASLK